MLTTPFNDKIIRWAQYFDIISNFADKSEPILDFSVCWSNFCSVLFLYIYIYIRMFSLCETIFNKRIKKIDANMVEPNLPVALSNGVFNNNGMVYPAEAWQIFVLLVFFSVATISIRVTISPFFGSNPYPHNGQRISLAHYFIYMRMMKSLFGNLINLSCRYKCVLICGV